VHKGKGTSQFQGCKRRTSEGSSGGLGSNDKGTKSKQKDKPLTESKNRERSGKGKRRKGPLIEKPNLQIKTGEQKVPFDKGL